MKILTKRNMLSGKYFVVLRKQNICERVADSALNAKTNNPASQCHGGQRIFFHALFRSKDAPNPNPLPHSTPTPSLNSRAGTSVKKISLATANPSPNSWTSVEKISLAVIGIPTMTGSYS